MEKKLVVRNLKRQSYEGVWQMMRRFTDQRTPHTVDELWLTEHPPIFTLGQAGKQHHLLHATQIPMVKTDRGGQITYHGPGQLIIYTLCNLHALHKNVHQFVFCLEQVIIDALAYHDIDAERHQGAPGVYVAGAKIGALGLRVRKGYTYHGLSLNIDMDLTPFNAINPCGYANLPITQLSLLTKKYDLHRLQNQFISLMSQSLGYNHIKHI